MSEELDQVEMVEIASQILEDLKGSGYSQIQLMTALKIAANAVEQSMISKVMMINLQKLLQ